MDLAADRRRNHRALPAAVVFGSFRSLDRHADDMEGRDPETARALRKARRDIDRRKGRYGP